MNSNLPYCSIIIPTCNRLEFLTACLGAMARLDYPRDCFEVIVVDDGSFLSLEPAIASFQSSLKVTLLTQSNAGPAAARNTGAKAAKGSILVFTDDDCEPHHDWLTVLVSHFSQSDELNQPAVVGGKINNASSGNIYSTASQGIIDYLYQHESSGNRFFTTNNLAIKATDFKEVGGFNETFRTAEDREFCDRCLTKGYQLIYDPKVQVNHAHNLTLGSFCYQQFNYGRGAFKFSRNRARNHLPQFQHWKFYLKLLSYPLRRWGFIKGTPIFLLFLLSQITLGLGRFAEAKQFQSDKFKDKDSADIESQSPSKPSRTNRKVHGKNNDDISDLIVPFKEALPYLVQSPHENNWLTSWLREYGDISPPRFYTFDDRSLIYMEVPKVACTSIKLTIGKAYQINFQSTSDIHEHEDWQHDLGKPQNTDYNIFSFVRNPYDRLVSCYRDKVVEGHYFSKAAKISQNYIPSNISFEEFVKIVCNIPDFLSDKHFKSQYALLSHNGKLLPDFVGHFETLEQDWKVLNEKYNFSARLSHKNKTTSTKIDFSDYYTQKLADLVYIRYENDFKFFGYKHRP